MDETAPDENPNSGPFQPQSSGDDTTILRRHRTLFGLLGVTVIAAVMILSAGPLVIAIDRFDLDDNVNIITQLASFVPGFVAIGYAGVVPMLLFRRPLTRIFGALIGQICGFAIFVLGCYIADEDTMSIKEWASMGGGLFLTCVMGGFLPIGFLIWFRRWALVDEKREPHTPHMGIVDLMALCAAGAGFLAFQKEYGIFASEFIDDIDVSIVIVTLFYSAIGMAITSWLLVAMRITLVERGDRINALTVIGILFTLALVFGFWGLLISVDGPMTDWDPRLAWVAHGVSSWMTAGLSAVGICLGLRFAGFRLTTIRTSEPS